MIENILTTYLAPAVILLLILVLILHGKRAGRQEKRETEKILDTVEVSGEQTPDQKPNLKKRVMKRLSVLPEDASFQMISDTVKEAAVENIPEDIFAQALEVFEDRKNVIGWLTSNVIALGHRAPIEVLKQENGKELVLTILERIKYGVYS